MSSQSPAHNSIRTGAKGNVPQAVRDSVAEWWSEIEQDKFFMTDIVRRMVATEMTFYESPDEPKKTQARVVFELDVTLGQYSLPGELFLR